MNTDTPKTEEIGAWIKNKRMERGLSLRALAEKAGMSHTSLDKTERGGGIREATLTLVVRALAGDCATDEAVQALYEEAKAVRAGMPVLSPDDAALLTEWHDLDPESQGIVLSLIRRLASRPD